MLGAMTTVPRCPGPTLRPLTASVPATALTAARGRAGQSPPAFGALLERGRRPAAAASCPSLPAPKRSERPSGHEAQRKEAGWHERSPRALPAREADPDLVPFRPLPAVIAPTPSPVSPPAARTDVPRLAEQLVTRLRVGRAREGAVVELRLSLAERGELDVRLVEAAHGIELHVEGADESLERALHRELERRGVCLAER